MINIKNKYIIDMSGMTLVEVLMTLIILGVVMLVITTMIVQAYNVFRSSTTRMSVGQLAEMTIREVSEYLKSATPVNESFDFTGNDTSWNFIAYYQDERRWFEVEFNGDIVSLEMYNIDNGERGTFIEERDLAYEIDEFIMTSNNGEFEIKIVYQDEFGDRVEKNSTSRSRNF